MKNNFAILREIPVSSTEGWRDDYYRGKIVSIPSLFTIQFAAVNHAWTRIDLMFLWRVHVMRTMRCAQVHDDEWAFTPRAESWLSSKDPTICKPELGRTPTIHRFFRFTPAQSCILIRADFIRNAWQLNECLRIFWQFLQILELRFFLFLLYFSELSTRFDEIYDKISICNF